MYLLAKFRRKIITLIIQKGLVLPNPAEYEAAMNAQNPTPNLLSMPDFQEMRRIALEQAIQQVKQQSQVQATGSSTTS